MNASGRQAMNAPIDTTSSAFYVWGIDRGAGTERFNTGPAPVPEPASFALLGLGLAFVGAA